MGLPRCLALALAASLALAGGSSAASARTTLGLGVGDRGHVADGGPAKTDPKAAEAKKKAAAKRAAEAKKAAEAKRAAEARKASDAKKAAAKKATEAAKAAEAAEASKAPPAHDDAPADDARKPSLGGPPGDQFVAVKPAPQTQTQKTAKERGGNPCLTADPGWGVYDKWERSPTVGQLILPQRGGITSDGRFDVMIHFHGHEAVRKEWVQVMDGAVLVGIDLGIGSGAYSGTFSSPKAFERLLDSVEAAVAKKTGRASAKVRKVGLSSWSAGYGAVQEILSQPLGRKLVDSVVLLDGLHCGYQGQSVNELQLGAFVEFAQRAAKKQVFMFVSHSSIIPPGYASTTETAAFLAYKLGGSLKRAKGRGPLGMDLIDRFDRGYFHIRGYAGNDKMDHCAHIGVYRDVLKVHIKPRWKSPKGRAAPAAAPPPSDVVAKPAKPAAPPSKKAPAGNEDPAVKADDAADGELPPSAGQPGTDADRGA